MIVVVLKKPTAPAANACNVELRVMIEGMTAAEGDALGQAIHEFALRMKRRSTLSAFQINDELVPH